MIEKGVKQRKDNPKKKENPYKDRNKRSRVKAATLFLPLLRVNGLNSEDKSLQWAKA